MRLSQVHGDVVEQPPNAKEKVKDKHVAKMSLKGVVGDDYRPVDTLVSRLRGRRLPHRPASTSAPTAARTGRAYSQEFTIPRIDIDKRMPTRYTRRMDEEVEPARGRAGAGAGR